MPWFNSTQMSSQYYERLLRGDAASLVEMSSIYSDAFQDSFSSLLNIPNMGNTRKIDESMRKNFSAWLALQKASYDYQTIVVDAWLEAFESLMQELAQIAEQGETLDTIRDFLNRWSALADETFKKTFHAEQYIRLQSSFVNAVMQYRKTQALMNEVIMEFYDMPTRSEIDEAHRRIYELQKELRTLKHEIALLKADKADKDC
jgi:class III poly(R)-hydroxyalkanoic acid synthase PhaE subunit